MKTDRVGAAICCAFIVLGFVCLRGGTVITLTDGAETDGPLTLASTTVSVQSGGSSPTEINHADILEASFGETPFQLNFFSSASGDRLPANWKQVDISPVDTAGSLTYADGIFTLKGIGANAPWGIRPDTAFFAGMPCPSSGQSTARVTGFDAQPALAAAGLTLREGIEPYSAAVGICTAADGTGWIFHRPHVAKSANVMEAMAGDQIPMNSPVWVRLTWYGATAASSMSVDGQNWSFLDQNHFAAPSPWVGLFLNGRHDKAMATAKVDQVSFTPAPSEAQILPPGVLLQSGSFLAGSFAHIELDPASTNTDGQFQRGDKTVVIPRDQIAAITMFPQPRSLLKSQEGQAGILMKNGDVMDGQPSNVSGSDVSINSILLGLTTYKSPEVGACLVRPFKAQPAVYEFRLRDGSIINASDFNATEGNVAIYDMSGVSITVATDEVAQLRAGTAQVQNLAELNWKALSPVVTPANPATATNAAAATSPADPAGVAPAAQAAPAVPTAVNVSDSATTAQGWLGPNEEEIIEVPLSTVVEFPLPGKFRAVGMRVALASDSPPNSTLAIRILADGREVARTPAFKAGDPPRYLQVSVQDPRTIAFEADSSFAGAKALLIDPVGIRDK